MQPRVWSLRRKPGSISPSLQVIVYGVHLEGQGGLVSRSPITHMSYSLNSFKRGQVGDYIGDYHRGHSGGYMPMTLTYVRRTRSLDNGSYSNLNYPHYQPTY